MMNSYFLTVFKIGALMGRTLRNFYNVDPDIFFFFSSYTIGGADKVHLKIVNCLANYKKFVFFTEKSEHDMYKKLYQAKNYDIYFFYRYRIIFKPLLLGFFSSIINAGKNSIIFGSNSRFFYDLIPYLQSGIKIVDLLHAFGGGFDKYSLPYVDRIDMRMVVNNKTLDDFSCQYRDNTIDMGNLKKLRVIENKVPITDDAISTIRDQEIVVLYAGRPSIEKRVYLIEKIASKCLTKNIPAKFIVAGFKRRTNLANLLYLGAIYDESEMERIYDQAAALMLLSTYEGFPLVVMEGMSRGVVPIATDVGGLNTHIKNGENGYLLSTALDEDALITSFCHIISDLSKNLMKLNLVRQKCRSYALINFSDQEYCHSINNFFKEIANA